MHGELKRVLFFGLLCFLCSCGKEKTGHLCLNFTFSVDQEEFRLNEMVYTNAAGNQYEINELKFFISDVLLYKDNGEVISVQDQNSIHYVDYALPATFRWAIQDLLPEGRYNAVAFVFGISPQKNKSNYFPNPPENNMSWPNILGGGYHYLMINGKWSDNGTPKPFNFHTGIGQVYRGNTFDVDSLIGFVHNNIYMKFPAATFEITANNTSTLTFNMNLNNWFSGPFVYDFNYWGGHIMQNQAAQQTIKENGADVFTVR